MGFVVNFLSLSEGEIPRKEEGWICGLSKKLENRRSAPGLVADYLICGKVIFCSLISAYVNGSVIDWFCWIEDLIY